MMAQTRLWTKDFRLLKKITNIKGNALRPDLFPNYPISVGDKGIGNKISAKFLCSKGIPK
jgi:hypothetical protein